MPDIFTTGGLALALLLVSYFLASRRRSAPPLPPGPKRLPLIGNVFDMPTEQEWYTFANWATRYGISLGYSPSAPLLMT
jgi:hypothetical protein